LSEDGPTLELLASLYADLGVVVHRGGRAYPTVVVPTRERSPDRLLRVRDGGPAIDPELRQRGQAHLDGVLARAPGTHDGRVTVATSVDEDGIDAVPGSYFDMIATCDALRAEYVDARASCLADLPLRELAHAAAGPEGVLASGRGRAAALGVSVVVTVRAGADRAFVIARRRGDLAADPGVWHVAPSGMVEPAARRSALIESMVREFHEELDRPAPSDGHLTVLGLAHDLLRLRPDVCLRMDLESVAGVRSAEYDAHALVPMTRDGLRAFWALRPPGHVTPAAAGAIALLEAAL
jgi:hypothetical protein